MRLLYVKWVDSQSTAEGTWHTARQIDDKVKPCHSVGWVLKETKTSITLVGSHVGEEYGGDITIPKVAIIKKRRIRL